MVLSHLSEKALKTGSVELNGDFLFVYDQLRKAQEAALQFLSLLNLKFVAADGNSHAASILHAAAWLTGSSLYQSFQEQKNLHGMILTPQDVSREWENLVYLLEHYNLQRADIPVGRVVLAAMAAPPFFRSQIAMAGVESELQQQYNAVMKEYGFNFLEGAHVGVMLCSILIGQYSQAEIIDREAATGIVAQEIFEAAARCGLP